MVEHPTPPLNILLFLRHKLPTDPKGFIIFSLIKPFQNIWEKPIRMSCNCFGTATLNNCVPTIVNHFIEIVLMFSSNFNSQMIVKIRIHMFCKSKKESSFFYRYSKHLLLPLNRPWWFTRNIIHHAVDTFNLINHTGHDAA